MNRLHCWLRPMPVATVAHLRGTKLGAHLRRLLLNGGAGEQIHEKAELLLYAADRAQCVEEIIKPQLAAGVTVLCERYTDSTLAYQGYARGIDLALVGQIDMAATGGLQSDLTIWLDVPVDLGMYRVSRRGMPNRMEPQSLSFYRRVAQYYAALAKVHPHGIVRVDASLSEECVAQQVQAAVSRLFEGSSGAGKNSLWGLGGERSL